ncbi:acyltransferase [uncultured Photobacterium sp.]|uniref:acyltransferase n=1 Tax=uncultured Photobacterium sp. TaxID=173973 RepID=UPI0026086E5A|nr:acyltransferase [uncultured Photobacterium sp.]
MIFSLLDFLVKTWSFLSKKMSSYYYSNKAMRTVKEYRSKPKVNAKSVFTEFTIIGHNCHFNGMEISGEGKVSIGDNFHSGKGCMIITQFHNYHGEKIPYDETYIIKDVMIEDNVWLGRNVIILGGVRIGEGAIIQAGTVLVKDVPKFAIVGQKPAKPFKSRDVDSYLELKRLKSYY